MSARTQVVASLVSLLAACAGGGDPDLLGGPAELAPPAPDLPALLAAVDVPTPAGASTCGAGAGTWRSWTPTVHGTPVALIQPAVGVLDGTIIIQGGRRGVADYVVADPTTYALTPASCTAPMPGYVVLETSGEAPAVWGAASTVAGGRFWVIGGTSTGSGECSRKLSHFTLAEGGLGRWVTLDLELPHGLCHAAATTVRGVLGHEWILVSGGSQRSVPNTDCLGGDPSLPNRALLLDPSAEQPKWIEFAGAGEPSARWGAAVATTSDGGAIILGGSMDSELPGATMDQVARVGLGADGVPAFAAAVATPEPRYMAAMATASIGDHETFQFVLGGATEQQPSSQCGGGRAGRMAGTASLWARDEATGELTALSDAPNARAGHAFVTVGGKLFAIGGQQDGTPVFTVDEYTP